MHSEAFESPRATYVALVRDMILRHLGISAANMFGVECVKADGKTCAAFPPGRAGLKLAGRRLRAALAAARRWDRSGRSRPMRESAHVPFDHAPAWPQLAQQARAYATPPA